MSNVFQNDFDSTQEAAPPEEPEPELFFEEPELYQTGPYSASFLSERGMRASRTEQWRPPLRELAVAAVGRSGAARSPQI